MPRRALLSPQNCAALFEPPTDREALVRHYTLGPDDIARIMPRRRKANRLGFAIQLCYLRHPGRTLAASDVPPAALIEFVAQQIGVPPSAFNDYAERDTTRREHQVEAYKALDLRPFTRADARSMLGIATGIALQNDAGQPLVSGMIAELRRLGIILPVADVLERLGLEARARARRTTYRALTAGLTADQLAALQRMIEPRQGTGRSLVAWLREPPEAAKVSNMAYVLERLQAVRSLGIDRQREAGITLDRLKRIAREGRLMTAEHLGDLASFIHQATWCDSVGGDEAFGLA